MCWYTVVLVNVRCPPRYLADSVAPRLPDVGVLVYCSCIVLANVRCPPRYVADSVAPRLPDVGVLVCTVVVWC